MLLYGMDREEGASAAVSELNDSVIGNSEASLHRLALAIDVDNEILEIIESFRKKLQIFLICAW